MVKLNQMVERINIWVVILVFSVLLSSMGIVMVIQYARLSDFQTCQASYNQAENEARYPRLTANAKENKKFYAWLKTLPPLLAQGSNEEEGGSNEDGETDPALLRKFVRKLNNAIQAHEDRIRIEKENPYPEEPDTLCGTFDGGPDA